MGQSSHWVGAVALSLGCNASPLPLEAHECVTLLPLPIYLQPNANAKVAEPAVLETEADDLMMNDGSVGGMGNEVGGCPVLEQLAAGLEHTPHLKT